MRKTSRPHALKKKERTPSAPQRPRTKVTKRKPRPTSTEVHSAGSAAARAELAPAAAKDEGARRALFPIVGIGASAGGLEALEVFLRNVPEQNGVAFVVVQHLDPTHKGMLTELLQRTTSMPVLQVKDRTTIEPEHVYVIPPNKDLSILHGVLHLLPPRMPRGFNLPIDFFFRSLAEDQQERGIGVILSGMGSDGTLGLRAIKERAGASFVQSPRSAKFDGMPRSVIDAGLADVVAPVEELPAKILAYRKHARILSQDDLPLENRAQSALEKVCMLLRMQTGNDFSLYKPTTILRRIERRMGLHQIGNIEDYVRFLHEYRGEIDLLFKELLIGVTSFFRDPAAWDHLKDDVMPALLARRSPGVLRAWVPGCSTGEEAYSLAMVFKEAAEPFRPVRNLSMQIFATDLDHDAIEKARHGLYPSNIAADVGAERLRKFFVQEERGYRVSKEVRELVVFAPQNLTMDPPFTKLDILACRNLLIYLSSDIQKKLVPLFHHCLNPGGVLFLGSAETIGGYSNLFLPLDAKSRLYRRLEANSMSVAVEFPSSSSLLPSGASVEPSNDPPAPKSASQNLQTLADRVLVQRFSPLGVLCNEKGDVLYLSNRAGKYLEPAVGKSNLNIFAMAREGLRFQLTSGFAAALKQELPVVLRNLKVGTNGGTQIVEVTIQKLAEPQELRGSVIVVIKDLVKEAPATNATKRRERMTQASAHARSLMDELQEVREELQSTREEMQTSQEELKSTNEELQSTNEELQSSNEELTTSKEEMQSLNEELQTVNHELQSKVDELSRSNNDMKNLLNSTNIATLFLDDELHVRRFTPPTAKIIKLIPGDVGRPLTDITSDLAYPELEEDARDVLRTLVYKEKKVATKDGRYFAVRIMPYRTLENVIDGLVITFSDASALQVLESALRTRDHLSREVQEALPGLVWTSRTDGGWDHVSRKWVEFTGLTEPELLGYGWLEQVHPGDRNRARDRWRAAVKALEPFDCELRIRAAGGGYRWFRARSAPIRDARGDVVYWFGICIDVEEWKRLANRENE